MNEKIKWALTVTISSLLGYIKLLTIRTKKDLPEWESAIKNKKVLIIGTGPSLDKADKEYFERFDTHIYINHAIKIKDKENSFFFTTDVGVLNDITKMPYFSKIETLGNKRSIVAPIFFQQCISPNTQLLNKITWIAPDSARYKISFKKILKIKLPLPPVLWPKQPSLKELDQWFYSKEQVLSFPIIEKTSALSAILFAAKYRPQKIRLIGCDFGEGRALALSKELHQQPIGAFSGAANTFTSLKEYLKQKSIPVENDSWAN
ncbi:hypothetical protein [Pseudomonas sp. OF001]|uniref:hypothetical protein n=1 Tax=Pseudomonas sp. OF001 TaxID=2772300 RepID=UPI00191ADDF2|nr:hypothetical protein [Pseudomonas sp. OF001]